MRRRKRILFFTVAALAACAVTLVAALTSAARLPTAGVAPTLEEDTYTPRPKGSVTFASDIAAILFEHCTPCHRPGEVAPFPLTTYQEARRRARLIGMMASEGLMPPWLPEEGYGDFAHSRRLSAEQVGLLTQWAREGAKRGDDQAIPPLPDFAPGWQGGEPDMVVEALQAVAVPADAFAITRNFVFRPELAEDRWLRGVVLVPSSGSVLRAFLFIDPNGATAQVAPEDVGAVLDLSDDLSFAPAPGFGGEIVDTAPQPFPEGVAQHLPRGASLLLQVYFQSTGQDESEEPKLGLYFADRPPSTTLVTTSLGRRDLEIPPGVADYQVRSSFTLPVEVEIVGVIPHAHLIAKELKGFATLPDGTRHWLIWIRQWDFTWGRQYWYRQPLRLPAGTVLEMDYTYDNSSENENNPNYPPETVAWGQSLRGEMAGLSVRMVVSKKKALKKLREAYRSYLAETGS